MTRRPPTDDGPLIFARFAYPPNALGLCGPADSVALFQNSSSQREPTARTLDRLRELRSLAQGFEGAWPYLQLIAAANQISDPLDPRVVQAYWIGNSLLTRVPVALLGGSLDERFRLRAGREWSTLAACLEARAEPHHNFHVFNVYPWVGLLRQGSDLPQRVLDQCRVRWGRVTGVTKDQAVVRSRPIEWDGRTLSLGLARPEVVAWRHDGQSLIDAPVVGDVVALHWGWLCQPLTPGQAALLRHQTKLQLATANQRLHAAVALN